MTTDELTLPSGYNAAGERLVAGVVPLNPSKTHVLLIQSTRRLEWVLPKGGWENDETCHEAAQREAWEEAGIVCNITRDLGDIHERERSKEKSLKNGDANGNGKGDRQKALLRFFEATVTEEKDEWPEREKRSRKWFTWEEAWTALAPRPELREALEKSSLNPALQR